VPPGGCGAELNRDPELVPIINAAKMLGSKRGPRRYLAQDPPRQECIFFLKGRSEVLRDNLTVRFFQRKLSLGLGERNTTRSIWMCYQDSGGVIVIKADDQMDNF